MNIFLVGGAGPFINALIDKLNKNGHRVYLLTGKATQSGEYHRTFEQYDFAYESSSIYEILAGVQPDAVLFLGAYDTNFDWQDARRASVRFTAGLTSILSACASTKTGRFLYLSSQEIFANSYAEDIPEEETPSAKDFRALALVQGEEICQNYQEQQEMDCVTVRLDHLYGKPVPGQPFPDPCVPLALKRLRGEPLSANSQHEIAMLHQNDAVEFLYCLLTQSKLKHSVYNLSSGQPVTEYQIAELLAGEDESVQLQEDASGGGVYRQVLSPARFQEEFPSRLFVDYRQGIQSEWKYIQKHKAEFLARGTAAEAGDWRHTLREIFRFLLPYLESVIFIFPVSALSWLAAQNAIFDGLDFYLLYELVIAVVHGQQAAIFAAFLAAGGYLLQRSASVQGLMSGLLNYETYLWMAQLLIIGMAVGYLKDQIQNTREEDAHEMGDLKVQLNEMEAINDSNVRMKQMFEQQIINQKNSLGKIYEITSELEKKSPEEVLFYGARVLSELMSTKDAAVYMVANDSYARLFSFTSQEAKKLGGSICYAKMEKMNQELQNRNVFINRDLDEHYPMMACGIYTNETNEKMQLILMLWGLPLEKMNLSEMNRLRVVSYLIQNAMLRSRDYLDALQNQRYLKGSRILNEAAFRQLVTSFQNAQNNQLTECALLRVENLRVDEAADMKKLEASLRQSDYTGVFHEKLYVLLCNTNAAGTQAVIDRLQKVGIETSYQDWNDTSA